MSKVRWAALSKACVGRVWVGVVDGSASCACRVGVWQAIDKMVCKLLESASRLASTLVSVV